TIDHRCARRDRRVFRSRGRRTRSGRLYRRHARTTQQIGRHLQRRQGLCETRARHAEQQQRNQTNARVWSHTGSHADQAFAIARHARLHTRTTVLINSRILHERPRRTGLHRLEQLRAWLAATLPGQPFDLAPASADASFRRYFRASFADGSPSRIVMDAPPEKEDVRPWLHVAELFRAAGAHVPEVLAQDLDHGFLLLSDLGSTTYLNALQPPAGQAPDLHRAAHLYADALGSLAAIQCASRPGVLPAYDRALLLRELQLFPEWYIARHKGVTLTDAETAKLNTAFERILAVNLAEPQVFVHRDYHSRNLMLLEPSTGLGANPGIIDFQDAVYGPISYDLVSLLKDAYIRWDEDFILDMLIRYWETARKLGLPVRA